MMMTKKILLGFAAALIVFMIYVGTRPADYLISRSIAISAPPEKIFPYLNNSKLAEQWAPWIESDPSAKMIYSGPDAGVGSKTNWTEGKELGTGSATIVESTPNERVAIQLEYVEPMTMRQYAEYSVEPADGTTRVTWKVTGQNNFIGRAMCIFMDMDKLVGGMFEKGLSNLKTLVEKKES